MLSRVILSIGIEPLLSGDVRLYRTSPELQSFQVISMVPIGTGGFSGVLTGGSGESNRPPEETWTSNFAVSPA